MQSENNSFKLMKKYYEEGKLSNMKGLLLEDNPYDPGTLMSVSWDSGWNSIKDNETANEGC